MNYGIPLVIVVTAIILIGGAYCAGTGEEIPPVTNEDNIKGNLDSGIVLVEYSDFECPACAAYSSFVKQLSEDFGDEIATLNDYSFRLDESKSQDNRWVHRPLFDWNKAEKRQDV